MNRLTGKNQKKFKNAVLYFSKYCTPDTVGKVKLAKLLYYLDFDHFEKHGEPVTRAKYIHKSMGPVPDDFNAQIGEMIDEGLISIQYKDLGYVNLMELVVAHAEPDMTVFGEEEMETLQAVLQRWQSASGSRMSEQSHEEAPWKGTLCNEEVPYQLALHRQ